MQYNASLLLINLALWMVMYFVCKPAHVFKPETINDQPSVGRARFLYLLLLITSVFAFCEHDFYHSWWDFTISKDYSYYEPVYEWLAYFVNEQYFLWRLIIWGGAAVSLYHLAYRLNNLTWEFLFTSILIFPTSYYMATRGTVGHALLLWSVIWLLPQNSLSRRKVILGVIGICASYFLHRSISLNIAIAVAAMLPLRFNKKLFIASLIAFPFLVGVVNGLLLDLISGSLDIEIGDEMGVAERAIRFADGSTEESFNLLGELGLIVARGPMYLMLFYCIIQSLYKHQEIETPYNYMFKLAYLCIYIGLLFAFQDASNWLYQRITFMGLFPLVFVFSRYLSSDSRRKGFLRLVLYFSIFSVAWYFAYRYYKWS